jgi:N4-(beta-N-acetylglucosaminyl)-L-asparaginase
MKINRRDLIRTSAALAASAALDEQISAAGPKNIVIASSNGLKECCARAMEILKSGGDTLDAVVAGVNTVELDPTQHGVGWGGLPNEDGVVELDASVMHGPTRRCGSVASIRNIRTPSRVAKLVMEQTDHIMLVGDGALKFAKDMGFEEQELLTEESRLAWLVWKQSLKDKGGHSNWGEGLDAPPKARPTAKLKKLFPHADDTTLAWAMEMAVHPITGTINCLALNTKGEMSGVTTTSGLGWKIAGRVGDSPIIGAGLYVDQEVGGAGSTGRGEENIRVAGAHTIVENMRHGMTPKDAILDCLKRISRNFNNDRQWLSQIGINFYALRKDGEYAGGTLWGASPGAAHPPSFTVNDGGATRLEPCFSLLQRA